MSARLSINLLEDALVDRLKAVITGVTAIEAYPDKPDGYRMRGTSAVLVAYGGSSYDDPDSMGVVTQKRHLEFDVTVKTRHMRRGSNDVLDAVRAALTGYQMTGCTKLYPVKDRFVAY